MLRIALGALVVAAPFAAAAHVAPSPDANNHYVKATLLPDRVRLTYTLLVGERPGADQRQRMDRDRDGRLDEAERAGYGAEIATRLAPAVTLDGRRLTDWRVSDVGVGDPVVSGGTFAVDLRLDAPYADPRAGEHVLLLDDAAAVPQPGETELRIDESPGVRVLEAHLAGARAGIELVYTFTGNASGAGERAVTARFSVDEALRPRPRRWPLVALAVAAGALALLALARRRRPG